MKRQVVSFNYTLKDSQGQVLDASEGQPLAYLEGAQQIIPALEAQLTLLTVGDKKTVTLNAKDAYGMPDDQLLIEVPKTELGHLEIQVGSLLQLDTGHSMKVVKVVNIGENSVTLDGNHPLAGQDLTFEVEITAKRDATSEELAHGHAHGEGGHHH